MPASTDLANAWFAQRGWKPFAFQRRVWAAVERGESGLLHASTGAGKTYAVWLAALRAFATSPSGRQPAPLQVLWVTPMRALAADTARALQAPLDELGLNWSVGVRSGDTRSAERARQARRLPSVLITTPESLTLLLTTVIAGGIVALAGALLPRDQASRAWLAGAVYLSMPVSWFAVFATTDTPLIFFMGLSIFTYVKAIRADSGAGIFLAGCFLGLAFLSKYFAVLLGFAFGFHLLFQRQRFKYLFLLLAGVMPFASVNIAYNLHNCWNNTVAGCWKTTPSVSWVSKRRTRHCAN